DGDALPTLFQHGWRHVDGDDLPGGAHGPGSQEGIEAAACTDIQDDLRPTGCAERERSAHAGKGPSDRVAQVYQRQIDVSQVADRVSWSGMEVIALLRIADDFAVDGLDCLAEPSGINWHRWLSLWGCWPMSYLLIRADAQRRVAKARLAGAASRSLG